MGIAEIDRRLNCVCGSAVASLAKKFAKAIDLLLANCGDGCVEETIIGTIKPRLEHFAVHVDEIMKGFIQLALADEFGRTSIEQAIENQRKFVEQYAVIQEALL